ncbi:hypothetical protein [Candidatus Magnetominusculus dajiuhuensis]|uniref:hypothetical protein n=1 Tax=Candidatus Magnetominusculus dajiuhuensis TaxID=3137712 RepID=UPI003B4348B1
MKKLTLILMIVSLLVVATALFAGEKIVGVIDSIDKKGDEVVSIVVLDEKAGNAKKTIKCEGKCAVKPGIDKGSKVTVETTDKGTTVRKAVAGC